MSETPADSFLKTIFDQMNTQVNTKKVYGEPVERKGVTVIPVAKVSWCFGAGAGTKDKEKGSGGGGGARAIPIGYIELKDDGARYRPIVDPARWAAYGVGGGLLALGSMVVLGKLIRRK